MRADERIIRRALEILRDEVPPHHFPAVKEVIKARLEGRISEFERKYRSFPVTFELFVTSPDFLDKSNILYPAIMEDLKELNNGSYIEGVLTGGIGSGKTTIALYTTAYQLYLLSCYKNPHEEFGLDPSSEIQIIFQSINAGLAKQVEYKRFKSMIETAPYFQNHFRFNKEIESKLVFPNRIEVLPVSGMETAAIGQNVIGGVIDELNYMSVVENSKSNVDGGVYDQAIALYNSISRRRKSRFMKDGTLPGILCLVSSKRYPGQFTDLKEEEAKTDPTIFVFDKRVWEVKPDGYSGDTFPVFTGDASRKPRMIEEGEVVAPEDEPLVMQIPEEHRTDFERDILNALREMAGVSTLATTPFFVELDKVSACFGKVNNILSQLSTDFDREKLEAYLDDIEDWEEPRFIHQDLGLTRDSLGMACGHVPGFKEIQRGATTEILPIIRFDFLLDVVPPKGGEIQFWRARELVYNLADLGLPIKWISFDNFQSADSIQVLRQRGFITGKQSMDKDIRAYEITKGAFYDGRILAPKHPKAHRELSSLEWDIKKGKIDHPPTGSKDIADAIAGVVFGLTSRREVWLNHDVDPSQMPLSLSEVMREDDQVTGVDKRAPLGSNVVELGNRP